MTDRYYRLLLVTSFALGVFAGLIDLLFPSALPHSLSLAIDAEMHAFSAPRSLFVGGLGAVIAILQLVSVIGLYHFRTWAPRLMLIATTTGILINVPLGASAMSGWASMVRDIADILWGAAIAITYFSPLKNRFARDGNSSADTQVHASPDVSESEIKRRFHELIASASDQIRWHRQWLDILEAQQLSGQSPERQRWAALNAACRLLGIDDNPANRKLPTTIELADILEGKFESSEMAQRRKKFRMAVYSIMAIGSAAMGVACFMLLLPWLGIFCLLFAGMMLCVVLSIRSGQPAWVNELFLEYFW